MNAILDLEGDEWYLNIRELDFKVVLTKQIKGELLTHRLNQGLSRKLYSFVTRVDQTGVPSQIIESARLRHLKNIQPAIVWSQFYFFCNVCWAFQPVASQTVPIGRFLNLKFVTNSRLLSTSTLKELVWMCFRHMERRWAFPYSRHALLNPTASSTVNGALHTAPRWQLESVHPKSLCDYKAEVNEPL